jgi:hypothetical protein
VPGTDDTTSSKHDDRQSGSFWDEFAGAVYEFVFEPFVQWMIAVVVMYIEPTTLIGRPEKVRTLVMIMIYAAGIPISLSLLLGVGFVPPEDAERSMNYRVVWAVGAVLLMVQ